MLKLSGFRWGCVGMLLDGHLALLSATSIPAGVAWGSVNYAKHGLNAGTMQGL